MASLVRRIDRVRRLRPAELRTLLGAWLLFAWVDLVVRTRPFPSWRHWLKTGVPTDGRRAAPDAVARTLALSEIAARHHWAPMNCLRRCLVQKRLLARLGVAAQVELGVCHDGDGGLSAHAWLVDRGRLLNDSPDVVGGYRVLRTVAADQLAAFTQS